MASLLEAARAERPRRSDPEHVVAIAAQLIEEWGLKPPISLDVLAGIRGIDRVERVPLEQAACLVATPGASVIRLRETDSPGRQNFSGCHEIGHTFMPGYQLQFQFRCDPRMLLKQADIEGLCDIAAVELLMPQSQFERDLREADWSFDTVDELAAQYGASREAAGRRVTTLAGSGSFFLKMEVRNKVHEPAGSKPCLRAAAHTPVDSTTIIPRLKSLDANDPLQAVVHHGSFDGVSSLSGLVPGDRAFDVSAVYSPWTHSTTGVINRRVLAIARPVKRLRGRRA